MLRVRGFHRILALIWVAVMAAVLVLPQTVRAEAPIDMKVKMGFEDQVKIGKWAPVRVELSNRGENLKGFIVVEATDPNGFRTQYQTAVSLPAGSHKKVNMAIPLTELKRNISVKLVAGGKTVKTVKAYMQPHTPIDILVGVFAADQTTMNHLAAIQLPGPGRTTKVVHPDVQELPDTNLVLENFDIIVLNDFDAGQLSAKQMQALESWVGQGGMLVIGGGPNWKKTISPLPAGLVPVEITGTKTMSSVPALAKFGGAPLAGAQFTVADSHLKGGKALVAQNQTPVLVESRKGFGRVFFVALDLALDPIAAWRGNASMWQQLITRANPFNSVTAFNKGWGGPAFRGGGSLFYALRNIPAMDLPSAKLLGWLLLGYLAAVGPLNYLVLKRLDKREWAWVTIPLIVVLFVVGVYGIGFKGKGREVLTNTISVVRLNPDMGVSQVRSYIGVFAPSKSSYKVELPGEKLISVFPSFDGGPYMTHTQPGQQGPVVATVSVGARTSVEYREMNMWSMRSFMVEDIVPTLGAVEGRLTTRGGKVYGEVVNHTNQTLSDSVVFNKFGFQRLGTLKPGETKQFQVSLTMAQTQPGPPVIYQIYNPYPVQVAPKKGQPPPPPPKPDRQKLLHQMVMEGAFGWESDFSTTDFSFVGWGDQPLDQVTVNRGRSRSYQTNLFFSPLKFNVSGPAFSVPAGLINGSLVAQEGNVNENPEGVFIPDGSATFQLELPKPPSEVKYKKASVEIAAINYGNPTIKKGFKAWLFNWETEKWDEFKAKSGSNPVSDLTAYISREGQLQVKVAPDSKVNVPDKGVNLRGISISVEGQVKGQ